MGNNLDINYKYQYIFVSEIQKIASKKKKTQKTLFLTSLFWLGWHKVLGPNTLYTNLGANSNLKFIFILNFNLGCLFNWINSFWHLFLSIKNIGNFLFDQGRDLNQPAQTSKRVFQVYGSVVTCQDMVEHRDATKVFDKVSYRLFFGGKGHWGGLSSVWFLIYHSNLFIYPPHVWNFNDMITLLHDK